jgi:hypothetical protein
MLRRIPKLLLLAGLLAAFAASSSQTFGNSGLQHQKASRIFCGPGGATNCVFHSGKCETHKCNKGEPCSFSSCGF